jgi:outer membrane protein assembly factor BamB
MAAAVRLGTVAAAAALALAAGASAEARAAPIPEGASAAPSFLGSPATPEPVAAREPPRNPFMAPNGRSEIHVDAYQSDANSWSGPLGHALEGLSSFQPAECASHTFDGVGRLLTICVGLERPTLELLDPRTLEVLAALPLPPRSVSTSNPFTDFSGGGYFYLDNRDRAVIPTGNRQVWRIRETGAPGLELERVYDLNGVLDSGDKLLSALPDWAGRIWFASARGVVGTIDRTTGLVRAYRTGEAIGNSFAVDETGGVFIVTDRALYRFDAARGRRPRVTWRAVYRNAHVVKPGQTEAGSGTTPTLMGKRYVSITDNADPMDVVVYRRTKARTRRRVVCSLPVFAKGRSASDNSLIGTDAAMVVENNYGYTGPASTENGATVSGGVERIDIDRGRRGCHRVWHSDERAPSVVPKLSRANGLVYLYTKDPQPDRSDAWYLTAVDFRTGRTVYKRLAGEGLGYNNNYAPITIARDGTVYVGVLAGLVRLRDARGGQRRGARPHAARRFGQARRPGR